MVSDMLMNLNFNDMFFWLVFFIIIVCGVIFGFYVIQFLFMVCCMENEKNGCFVFFGVMIGEGVIVFIWCVIVFFYFDNLEGLLVVIINGGFGNVVYVLLFGFLGVVGGVLVFFGVVIFFIMFGDIVFCLSCFIMVEYFNVE